MLPAGGDRPLLVSLLDLIPCPRLTSRRYVGCAELQTLAAGQMSAKTLGSFKYPAAARAEARVAVPQLNRR